MAEGSAAPAPAPGDGICVSSSWERKPAGSERGGFVTAGHRGVPPALTHPNVLFGRDSSPFSLKAPFLTLFPSFPTPWGRNSLFRPPWRRLFRVLGFLAKVWCVPAGGRRCRREMQLNNKGGSTNARNSKHVRCYREVLNPQNWSKITGTNCRNPFYKWSTAVSFSSIERPGSDSALEKTLIGRYLLIFLDLGDIRKKKLFQ